MRTRILFTIGALLLLGIIHTNGSWQSHNKLGRYLQLICGEQYYDKDLNSEERRHWSRICRAWLDSQDHQQHMNMVSEAMIDGKYIEQVNSIAN